MQPDYNPNSTASATSKPLPRCIPAEVYRTLTLIVATGQVCEVRALDATLPDDRWPGTVSGYFDDPTKLIESLATVKTAKGVYITLNPIEPALLARAANRLRKAPKGECTSDNNIVDRRWLLIDCDAQRPAGISATNTEHNAAIDRCRKVYKHLREVGWPEPVAADSGNGGHLLYRVDLPVDDGRLVERCLAALAAIFDCAAVKIDQTVFNAARITKLYGTLVAKGDNTPDRPHRMARILSAPDTVQVVDRVLLESLASEAPVEQIGESYHWTNGKPFDVDTYIAQHGFEVDGPERWQGGRRWVFRKSPLCEHHDGAAFLIQLASGALVARCHHKSCSWTRADLLAKYEPSKPVRADRFLNRTGNEANLSPPSPLVVPREPFPVSALPSPVGDYVRAASEAIGCDTSFVALPLLGCLARAIGNKRTIQLKETWQEPSIIWAAIVGKSGTHKSPALLSATQHLQRRQGASIARYVEAMAEFEQDKAVYERAYQDWKRAKSSGPPPTAPPEPVCERYIVGDITVEALAERLEAQFDGLLMSRDELAGWLDGIAEYKGGKGSDTGHWLSTWSAAPLTVDRKTGKKMIYIPRAAVSIVGGIQPGVLKRAIGHEHMQDGLCARLLLTMPENRPVTWTDTIIDPSIEAALDSVIDQLLTLEPGTDEDGDAAPLPLPLTPEAKAAWVEFYNRHRTEQVELDDDLAAAWSKLEAYAARFALIFQMCSWAAGDATGDSVTEASIRAGITLADWFGNEARRVYAVLAESELDRQTRELVELIRRKGGSLTVRELMRSSRQHSTSDEAEGALEALVKAKLGRWEVAATATNQTRVFVLTPSTLTDSRESREVVECVNVSAENAVAQNGRASETELPP